MHLIALPEGMLEELLGEAYEANHAGPGNRKCLLATFIAKFITCAAGLGVMLTLPARLGMDEKYLSHAN